jgi:1,2-diacylglycerol 3-alpha-glucosyltransferase
MNGRGVGPRMRVGIVSYWFNRGQAVVSRRVRAALDAAGVETFVLARPTKEGFVRSRFIDRTGPWAQRGVTAASRYEIPEVEYLAWAADNVLDVVLCDQNLQFAEIAALRQRGVRTVGRFVWEAFRPEDVARAVAAFDTIYSVTRCEQRRYAGFGITSPLVRWAPPPELAAVPRPPRPDGEVRFFYPGGYLSDRKPTAETIAAFRQVRDPRARLILKVQDPVRGPKLAAEALAADPRIRAITADLPDDEHHRLMASCDVLLAPTRWEGLGLHHGEAIALGLPAITNDFPPMNENVAHDVDGWLVPAVWQSERVPGVPRLETPVEPLAAAIEALCDDDRRARLAAGVRRRRAVVTWNDTTDDLVELVTGRPASRAAA